MMILSLPPYSLYRYLIHPLAASEAISTHDHHRNVLCAEVVVSVSLPR